MFITDYAFEKKNDELHVTGTNGFRFTSLLRFSWNGSNVRKKCKKEKKKRVTSNLEIFFVIYFLCIFFVAIFCRDRHFTCKVIIFENYVLQRVEYVIGIFLLVVYGKLGVSSRQSIHKKGLLHLH